MDATKLYQQLGDPRADIGAVIEMLDAQKESLRPEDIINHSLKLDSEYAQIMLQLVEGTEVPIDLQKLNFQLDKIDSVEYRIKLLHYLGSVNEPKVPLIVARFLDDDNKVVILEALKTLNRMQFNFDLSMLLPYAQTMSGIQYEQVISILDQRADAELVPHLSAYLSGKSEQLNDFFGEIVATRSDVKNFEKFLKRLILEEPDVQRQSIDCVKKFANKDLSRIAHELSNHGNEEIASLAQCLVVNLIEGEDLDKIEKFLLNDSAKVRERAIQSLAKSANRGAISMLQKLVNAYPEDTVLALRGVQKLGFEHGLELAYDSLRVRDANIQRAALETIESLVNQSCAEDGRNNIVKSLKRLDEKLQGFANELVTKLNDKFGLTDFDVGTNKPGVDMLVEPDINVMSTSEHQRLASLDDFTAGSVWMDRYHIKEEIGRGAMGRVLLVEDDMVDEDLIIKFMLPGLTIDKKSTERFKREVKYARRISHRNVIRVHDLLIKDGICAISMEFFKSRGLDMILRDGKPFELREGLKLLYQIASGMTAAHEQGVIHRDLKPSNVLINSEGHLKVVDFGIASAGTAGESTLTQTGSIIGSPAYLAPERAIGTAADERSDIYSLGVVAYYVLTGKLPYTGAPMEVVMQHRQGKARPVTEVNPEVTPEIAELVARMMKVEPAERLQTMADVRDRIRSLLA